MKNPELNVDEARHFNPASFNQSNSNPWAIFALLFFLLVLLHLPLLRLPYFWDEAGYYIPAGHDLLLTGSLIPQSTPSNAHPPLVMAYLALWWKVAGFHILITRVAMLAVAAFSLTGLFLLARRIASWEVATASILCTAFYPVFFTQSSLAQLDLTAAGLTFWALLAYVEKRPLMTAVWFSVAVLAKETAILAPLALIGFELIRSRVTPRNIALSDQALGREGWIISSLLFPLIQLVAWYAYHFHQTGFIFGNPEFFRYNVQGTIHPLRILLAFLMRLWQTFGYLTLWVLTLATIFAMRLPAITDNRVERKRIAIPIQFAFLAIVITYSFALAIVGGAVLARYMLPVIPLVIIVCLSTLRRRVRMWKPVVALVVTAFVSALFINPPYGFSMEDNLAYHDYVILHQRAESFIVQQYSGEAILTAWPASDELSRSYLGYVNKPVQIFRVEDFTVEELIAAKASSSRYDAAFVFSTKYQPAESPFESLRLWQDWKHRFFGYHRDLSPETAAQILQGRLVYTERRNGQWVGVIEMPRH